MRTKDQDPLGPKDTSSHSTNNGQDSPGYETTDVNIGGIIVFLAGLSGFLLIFFFFCFGMGKVINSAFLKEDGPPNRWNQQKVGVNAPPAGGKRQDLTSDPVQQQRELQHMTTSFPGPRLQTDDGNQDTADLHAREDLLLDHYSSDPADSTSIRIPIDQAMRLIAQRGLPMNAAAAPKSAVMAGDVTPVVTAPLTDGFARTGYELDVMEARAQKMSYGKAESAAHAELRPVR